MNLYIITYDLISPGQNYLALTKEILTQFPNNYKLTESCWLIKSNLTAKQIRDVLLLKIDKSNDKLFVATLTKEASWTNLTANGNLNDFIVS